MNVLVINAGSSSLKYQLLDTKTREVYAKGNCERIGIDGSFVGHEERGGEKQKLEVAMPDHKTAVKYVFQILDEAGFDTAKIEGIGHRVVQGDIGPRPHRRDGLRDGAPLHGGRPRHAEGACRLAGGHGGQRG